MRIFRYLLPAVLIITVVAAFQEKDPADDVVKYNSKWGLSYPLCGDLSKDSYTVFLRNDGKSHLDIKVAVQEKSKSWRYYYHKNVAPKDTIASYACQGTGKFLKWARAAGDEKVIVPTDKELTDGF